MNLGTTTKSLRCHLSLTQHGLVTLDFVHYRSSKHIMKPIIFPLTTLVAMCSWYFINNQKIGNLKESLTQNDTTTEPLQIPKDPEKAFIGSEGVLDLERVGSFLTKVSKGETKSNGGNAWLWTTQQLNLVDTDSLLDLYNELENTDFPTQERSKIESLILAHLRNKDPELYLQHFGIKPGINHHTAANAFRKLIKKDSQTAIAWFDEYLKKTNLGEKEAASHTSARVTFETVIAKELYPDHIEALGIRFQNLHGDQTQAILTSLKSTNNQQEKLPQHFLELVRNSLSESQSANLIASVISNTTSRKELPEVAEIIAEYTLTPREELEFYKYLANQFAWESRGDIKKYESLLPFLRDQGVTDPAEVYAKGISKIYSNELCGTGDLTNIYQYVQKTGESQNLNNLLTAFVETTTSRVCECCCLEGRLSRISDQDLKNQISTAYQQNLDSSK